MLTGKPRLLVEHQQKSGIDQSLVRIQIKLKQPLSADLHQRFVNAGLLTNDYLALGAVSSLEGALKNMDQLQSLVEADTRDHIASVDAYEPPPSRVNTGGARHPGIFGPKRVK